MVPIRPGIPEIKPFWNSYSKRFINAPSFDFKDINNAGQYLFTVISDENYKYYSFKSDHPWASLTPVWKELPVGIVYAKAEGLDSKGNRIGLCGERMFYKAAAFNGPYKERVIDFTSSAKLNLKTLFSLQHIQNWKTAKAPSPDYLLYCYPSKTIGSIVQGMVLYSRLSLEDKESALQIAKNAADYLIRIREPAGAVLEFFPPTYAIHNKSTDIAKERIGELMMFYPSIVGSAFLDLYEEVQEKKYLDAAVKIAETYQKCQLPAGSWPLTVDIKTGGAISGNITVPTDIISFLDRLVDYYQLKKFKSTRDKAFNWIMNNPVKTFDWEAQFEDMGYSKNYSNLERGKPLAFAQLLLKRAEENPEYITLAEELIAFAEDQFVIWERPLARELLRTATRPIPTSAHEPGNWMLPCVLEQYDFYTPIDASAASAILAFKKAYDVTGKELYLAKAVALANAQTYAQQFGAGIYPTYQRDLEKEVKIPDEFWINCAIVTSYALLELDKSITVNTALENMGKK